MLVCVNERSACSCRVFFNADAHQLKSSQITTLILQNQHRLHDLHQEQKVTVPRTETENSMQFRQINLWIIVTFIARQAVATSPPSVNHEGLRQMVGESLREAEAIETENDELSWQKRWVRLDEIISQLPVRCDQHTGDTALDDELLRQVVCQLKRIGQSELDDQIARSSDQVANLKIEDEAHSVAARS